MTPRLPSTPPKPESTVMNGLHNLRTEVTDLSHHNEYNLTGNATFYQHHGTVYNQTTNQIHHIAEPKPPSIPRCPAPSPNYTTREAIENHMHFYFFDNRRGMKRYVLHGPGGTGKTEIALTLVDRHCYSQEQGNKRFQEALWIDATSDETIKESFKAIGISIGTGPEIEGVLRWLASLCGRDANWIVLFNNADSPNLDLARYFPKCSHGNILITTRNYNARCYGVGPGSDHAVAEMTADQALKLFRKHARLFENASPFLIETAAVLVEEVGRFALAVTQAGAFVSHSQCSLTQYRALYHDQRQELQRQHEEMQSIEDYPYRSLQATWMVSYTRLSDPTKELLQVFGCVHHEGIREDMFSKPCSGGIDKLESRCGALFTESEKAGFTKLNKLRESLSTDGKWDSMRFRWLIRELRSYSLVTFDPEKATCSIHPLVHEWVRHVCDMKERAVLHQCAILLLGSSLLVLETTEELAFCRALASHVDQIFREIEPKTSACGEYFGRVYMEAGRWNDAVAHGELFRELCAGLLGEEHPNTLTSMNSLALTYLELGRTSSAEKLLSQTVEIRKRTLGPEHPHTLTTMSNLALTYWRSGRYKDAEKLHSQTMEIRQRVLGAEHPDTLVSMGNLGMAYLELGRANDAEKLQLQVVEVNRRILGLEHPDTLLSMNNLAFTYSQLGRINDAEKLQFQTVEIRKRVLGAEHPHTFISMSNLGMAYLELGRAIDAEKLQLQVLEAYRRMLGPEHPRTLITMSNLALIYLELGRTNAAEKLHSKTVEIFRRVLGPEHPDTLKSEGQLASTYLKLGRTKDAEKLQLRVLEACRRVLGPEHPHTLSSMNSLAVSYLELERFDDAEKLQSQTVEIRKRALGAEHPDTLVSMGHLASIYLKLRRTNDAEKLQLRVLEDHRRILGPEHPHTLDSMNGLAVSYLELGRFDDAEKLQSQTVELRKRVLGPEHPDTLISMSNLALAYSRLRRDNDAKELQSQTVEVQKRVLGPEHPYTLTSMRDLSSIYKDLGKLREADELAQQTLATSQRVLGAEHPITLTANTLLSQIRKRRKNRLFNFFCLNPQRNRR